VVEYRCLDADQAAFTYGAAMQHGLMPNRDIRSDTEGYAGVGVQHRAILDFAVGSDVDRSMLPRSTALNHTLTLFSRMTAPMTEAVSAMKCRKPRNSGTRSFSR
jgi:hypothetical protein